MVVTKKKQSGLFCILFLELSRQEINSTANQVVIILFIVVFE